MKFDELFRHILIIEDIQKPEIIYQDMSIVFIPGSFKPPTKSDWDLILQYTKQDKIDKVVVIISDISKEKISKNNLSKTNLTRFSSILSEIEQETDIDLTKIKQYIMNKIENLSYDDLLLICKKDILPQLDDQKIKERILNYFSSLDKILFKNIKMTDTNIEITAQMSLKIFQLYNAAYTFSNKIEFKIAESQSPVQDMMYIIKNNCNNCKIYLGSNLETKDKFSSLIANLYVGMNTNNLVNNIIEYPIQQEFSITENKVRKNCKNLKRQWFPDNISDTTFNEIKKLLSENELE